MKSWTVLLVCSVLILGLGVLRLVQQIGGDDPWVGFAAFALTVGAGCYVAAKRVRTYTRRLLDVVAGIRAREPGAVVVVGTADRASMAVLRAAFPWARLPGSIATIVLGAMPDGLELWTVGGGLGRGPRRLITFRWEDVEGFRVSRTTVGFDVREALAVRLRRAGDVAIQLFDLDGHRRREDPLPAMAQLETLRKGVDPLLAPGVRMQL